LQEVHTIIEVEGPVPDKEVEEEDIGFLICCDLLSISL
jgi:hypothetical protein